jgi:superfamily II DNA or RNA helicase
MSVLIPRSSLDKTQIGHISNLLVMQPKEPWVQSNRFTPIEPKPPIVFYHLDGEQVAVPFMFGAALTKTIPNDNKSYPSAPFSFTGSLLSYQTEAAESALKQINQFRTTTLNLYPGFGKTVLASWLASKVGLLTLVLFHREFLAEQWATTFREFTNAKTWIVGQPVPQDGAHVILCMDTRISQLPKEYLAQVGCLMIDEVHCFCTPSHVNCLLATQPRVIIAMSATLERDDGMHSMIHAMCGQHAISKISSKPFQVIKLLTGITPETKQGTRGIDWSQLNKTLAESPQVNSLILDLVRENVGERKILILTALVSHTQTLCQMINNMGIHADYMAGTKKTYNDPQVLVGTVSKIGTGFDEKTVCSNYGGKRIDMAIVAFSTKKATLLEQTVGRAFRAEFPTIIHLVHDNSTIKRHWGIAQKWYLSRNGKITEFRRSFPQS